MSDERTESTRGSRRRSQWTASPGGAGELLGNSGDEQAGTSGTDGSAQGGRPRRGRSSRVLIGALALMVVAAGVIAATLPKGKTQTVSTVNSASSANSAAAGSGQLVPMTSAAVSTAATATVSAKPSPTKPSASATPSTASQQAPTAAAAAAPNRTAASSPSPSPNTAPPTVNVLITDTSSGLVLDVDNSGTAVGTLIGTWGADSTAAQRWHLVLQPDNSYVIYSEIMDMHEGLDINTDPNQYSGNTITTMQNYTGNSHMRWTAVYLGSGKYQLKNRYNGQCLQGAGQGVANATVACNSSNAHQVWTITG
jgi:hypothetical protein